jgi:hypothetical protein
MLGWRGVTEITRQSQGAGLDFDRHVSGGGECLDTGAFDGVADFDAALHDPKISTQMRAVDDCGDGLHPSDSGYCKMGDAIDLALFD